MAYVTLLFILAAALCCVIPVAIGVYVYKDAKSRNMNAALWTLIAVIAPTFIGLIIYLVARSDHSALSCPKCGTPVEESFSVCPRCGNPLKSKCPGCGFLLQPGWTVCPSCAEPIPAQNSSSVYNEPKREKSVGWIIALVVIIPLLLCGLLIVGLLAPIRLSGDSWSHYTSLSMQYASVNPELTDWINQCDAQGKGIYVLKSIIHNGDEVITQYLIYRNDGYYEDSIIMNNSGLFKGPEFILEYTGGTENGPTNYTLSYCEYHGKKETALKINDPVLGNNAGYKLTEINNIDLSGSQVPQLDIFIRVSASVKTIYSVKINYYDIDGNVFNSKTVSNTDGSPIKSVSFNEQKAGIAGFTVSFNDESGTEIYMSDKYNFSNYSWWSFDLEYGNDGAITMTDSGLHK